MDIYSDSGQYLGEVQDVILDLEKGEVSRILMSPWKNLKSDVKSALKKKSILYKNVKNVGDVVLVGSAPQAGNDATREEAEDLYR